MRFQLNDGKLGHIFQFVILIPFFKLILFLVKAKKKKIKKSFFKSSR